MFVMDTTPTLSQSIIVGSSIIRSISIQCIQSTPHITQQKKIQSQINQNEKRTELSHQQNDAVFCAILLLILCSATTSRSKRILAVRFVLFLCEKNNNGKRRSCSRMPTKVRLVDDKQQQQQQPRTSRVVGRMEIVGTRSNTLQ